MSVSRLCTVYGADRGEEPSEQQVVRDGRQHTVCPQIRTAASQNQGEAFACCFLTAGQVTAVGPDGGAVVVAGAAEG